MLKCVIFNVKISHNIWTETKSAAKVPDASSGRNQPPCTTTYIRIVFSNIKYQFWRRSLCTQLMFISLKHRRAPAHTFVQIIIDFLFTPLVLPYEEHDKHLRGYLPTNTDCQHFLQYFSYKIKMCLEQIGDRKLPALPALVCHTSDQIHEIKLKLMYIELKAFHNHW